PRTGPAGARRPPGGPISRWVWPSWRRSGWGTSRRCGWRRSAVSGKNERAPPVRPTPCCARPGDRGARTCSERCRGRAPGAVLLPPVTGVRSSVTSCSVVVVVVRAVPADGAAGSPPEGGPVSGPAGGARSAGLGEQHHEDDRADAADQVVLRLDAHGEGDEGDDPHRPE